MEQRPRVVIDIVFTCVVLHNMLRTHQGGANRAPTPGNEAVAQEYEQAVYVPNENYRNHSREAKHQQELLKDYFNHIDQLFSRKLGRYFKVQVLSIGLKFYILISHLVLEIMVTTLNTFNLPKVYGKVALYQLPSSFLLPK